MHYEIKFTGTRTEQYQQARKAAREYLGKKRYDTLLAALRGLTGSMSSKLRGAYFYTSFVGVRGRTVVHALFKHAMESMPIPE